MIRHHWAVLAVAVLSLAVGASAKDTKPASATTTTPPPAAPTTKLSPVLPGWDSCKWNDPNHMTPKYVVGRIVAPFPHTPAGLKEAEPLIAQMYPGSHVVEGGKGDKIDIACVGVIDMVVAAGGPSGGDSWSWQVVEDKCGKCPDGKNHCEDVSKSKTCGDSGSAVGGVLGPISGNPPGTTPPTTTGPQVPPAGSTRAPCVPPNAKPVAERIRNEEGMDLAFRQTCRNGTNWAYMEALIDELNRLDGKGRWGYWCRRGNCNDPSHDVLAFYCGTGTPQNGNKLAAGVDFITASCYNIEDWEKENPGIGWGEAFGGGGSSTWVDHHP